MGERVYDYLFADQYLQQLEQPGIHLIDSLKQALEPIKAQGNTYDLQQFEGGAEAMVAIISYLALHPERAGERIFYSNAGPNQISLLFFESKVSITLTQSDTKSTLVITNEVDA